MNMDEYKSNSDLEHSPLYLERLKCVCRLCLVQPQEIELFGSSHSQNNLKYSEIVMHLANVKIDEDDNLPKAICEECSSKLILFFKFKQKIESSQYKLLALLQPDELEDHTDEIEEEEEEETYMTIDNEDIQIANEPILKVEELQETENEEYEVEEIIADPEQEEPEEIYQEEEEEEEQQEHQQTVIEEIIMEEDAYHLELVEDEEEYENCEITYKIVEDGNEEDKLSVSNNEHLMLDEIPSEFLFKSNKMYRRNKQEMGSRDVRYKCEICGQCFARKSTLVQHSSVHSEEKRYECDICQKKFTRRGHVTVHMRAHNNIRPYACDICSRAFTKSGDLSRHKKIHSDIHDYYCSICGKGFKRSEYLQSHLNMHTGIKPFHCKSCDKEYSSYSSMTKHCKKYNH